MQDMIIQQVMFEVSLEKFGRIWDESVPKPNIEPPELKKFPSKIELRTLKNQNSNMFRFSPSLVELQTYNGEWRFERKLFRHIFRNKCCLYVIRKVAMLLKHDHIIMTFVADNLQKTSTKMP